MRVLVLTKYADAAASSRVRFLQYFPYLEQHDIQLEWSPLLDNRYIQFRYGGKKISKAYLISRYWYRLKTLFSLKGHYDVIWLEAELFPYVPWWLERLCWLCARRPIVVNYDDAIFHNYDLSSNRLIKWSLRKKIAKVMQYAHTVIVGNNYLSAYAENVGAQKIVKLPTVVDLNNYQPATVDDALETIRIGWIGTPSTLKYLKSLSAVFERLVKMLPITIYIMGADGLEIPGVEVKFFPWSADSEVSFLQKLDIGVMPLKDSPWERGKCGYKLIQYMACAKPVVGSPIEINKEIIENGVNGLLAESDHEWLDAMLQLAKNSKLRHKMGQAGHKKVQKLYSVQATEKCLVSSLLNAQK